MTILSAITHAKTTFQTRTLETILTEGRDMTRHRLDGNAIAADMHYGQDRGKHCTDCWHFQRGYMLQGMRVPSFCNRHFHSQHGDDPVCEQFEANEDDAHD